MLVLIYAKANTNRKKVFYQIIKKPYILCSESACFMLTVPEHGDPLPSPAGHTQL